MSNLTARERIKPPAVETTSEQDFRAQVKYFVDERVGDLAYELLEAQKIIKTLLGDTVPDDELKKRLDHLDYTAGFADFLMEDGDFMAEIERITWLKEALSESHEGDCVAVPCSCLRCHAEDYYDIPSSRSWTSKHEGWSLYNVAKAETNNQ